MQPPALSVEAVLPTGNLVNSCTTPRSANGPDLFSLFLGSWGGFGVITRAVLKLEPLPEFRLQAGFHVPSTERAIGILKDTVSYTIVPRRAAVIVERKDAWRKARVILAHEGERGLTMAAMDLVRRLSRQAGGREEEPAPQQWPQESIHEESHMQIGVRWSRLMDLLRMVDERFPEHQQAVIDKPCLTGCRLSLDLPPSRENWLSLACRWPGCLIRMEPSRPPWARPAGGCPGCANNWIPMAW
jgi:hypothetical protein